MRTFVDSTGRNWVLTIAVGDVKRVKGLLGVDLLALHEAAADGPHPSDRSDPTDPATAPQTLLERLESDVCLRCDVLYVLVKPAADAAGVSDEAFGQAMGGQAFADASTAFWEELADFFRPFRPVLAELVGAYRTLISERAKAAMAAAHPSDPTDPTDGKPSTGSPASAGSPPTPTPSGS